MPAAVATVHADRFLHLDPAGSPVTGLTQASYAERLATLTGATGTVQTTAPIAIVEQSGGWYGWSFTPSAVGIWSASIVYSAVSPARRWTGTVEVVTARQADPAGAVLAGTVAVVSPVAQGGDATIVRGDDYLASLGTALSWSFADLTIPAGATCAWTAYHPDRTVALTKAMTVAQAGPPALLSLDLTRAETTALVPGTSVMGIVMTRTGGAVTTLLRGELKVQTLPP